MSEDVSIKVDQRETMGCMWLIGLVLVLGLSGSLINAIANAVNPDHRMTDCIEACGSTHCASWQDMPERCACVVCE